MDLLFKRYADPFPLMDGYIRTSRFCDFLHTVVKQKEEDDKWEYFLHKVWGNTSYDEFCKSLRTTQDLQGMSEDDIETTIMKSMDILGNFNPEQEEGEV